MVKVEAAAQDVGRGETDVVVSLRRVLSGS